MARCVELLTEELNSLLLSVDTIDIDAESLSDRKINSIIDHITRIQTLYFSLENSTNFFKAVGQSNTSSFLDVFISTRDSIHDFKPVVLKTTLAAVTQNFITILKNEVYSTYASNICRDYFESNKEGFNVDKLNDKIYKVMTSISGINRDMNMMIVNPFHYNQFENFIAGLPESFKHHKLNTYIDYTSYYVPQTSISHMSNIATEVAQSNLGLLRATTKAFDIVFYHPVDDDISSNAKDYDVTSLSSQIRRAIYLTRKGGLFMCTLPASIFNDKLFSLLHTMLTDFNVTIDFIAAGSIFVYGIRKNKDDAVDTRSVNAVSSFFYDLRKNTCTDLPDPVFFNEHTYPTVFKKIKIFRGRYVSTKAVNGLKDISTLASDVLSDISTVKQKESRPLLPFSKGQLGMILTSGVLNGVINEGDNKSHVVKGVVIKNEISTEENDHTLNQNVVKTVLRNKIELMVLQPNGNFIALQ